MYPTWLFACGRDTTRPTHTAPVGAHACLCTLAATSSRGYQRSTQYRYRSGAYPKPYKARAHDSISSYARGCSTQLKSLPARNTPAPRSTNAQGRRAAHTSEWHATYQYDRRSQLQGIALGGPAVRWVERGTRQPRQAACSSTHPLRHGAQRGHRAERATGRLTYCLRALARF